jgi:hypothetical protein
MLFQKHVVKDTQEKFIESFDPTLYHENMTSVSKPRKSTQNNGPVQSQEMGIVMTAIEQYDFYHK